MEPSYVSEAKHALEESHADHRAGLHNSWYAPSRSCSWCRAADDRNYAAILRWGEELDAESRLLNRSVREPSGYEGFVESAAKVGEGAAKVRWEQARIDDMNRQCDMAMAMLPFFFAGLFVLYLLFGVLAS